MTSPLRRTSAVLAATASLAVVAPMVATSSAQAATPAHGTTHATAAKRTATKPTALPKNIDKRCLTTGRVMCIDKTQHKLYYVVDKKLVLTTDVRVGRPWLPTREGSFRVFRMSAHYVSHEYHAPMPDSMFFSGGEAVHYSADFAAHGYGVGSHGCVNVRNWHDITYLFNHTHLGDKVVVYRSR